jgi:hypothetical protein
MLTMKRMKWFVMDPKYGFALPLLDDIDPRAKSLVIGINYLAPGNGGGFEWVVQ